MDDHQQRRLFDEWIDRHKGLILKVVRAYARTPHDQEDLFQEVAFQLWNSLAAFRDVAESTWTYRVALYTSIGWARKERNRTRRSRELEGDDRLLAAPAEPADERLEWLYEQIGMLDEFDRSLAILLLDGCSYKQMAEVLGVSVNNVGVKINRIKKALTEKRTREHDHEFRRA